jgi:hypothetical protein
LNFIFFYFTFEISALESKYSWINEEKQYFGNPGGSYDFSENDPHEAGKRISKLGEKSEKLGRNINTRAMNLLGKEEEQVKCSKTNLYELAPGLPIACYTVTDNLIYLGLKYFNVVQAFHISALERVT